MANTTPLTTIGVAGDIRSADVQSGSSENVPLTSLTRSATTAPLRMAPFVVRAPTGLPETGTRTQRVAESAGTVAAAASRAKVDKAAAEIEPPLANRGGDATSGVAWSAPPSDAASSRITRPSFVAAETTSFVPCRKTVGPVTNSAVGCVNQSFSCSDSGFRATIALLSRLLSRYRNQSPRAAYCRPTRRTAPTTLPPFVR